MKLFETLDEENFVLFAAKNYYNPSCIDAEEFYQDLKRFKYIKRLLTKYEETGKLSTNLLLNHLVVVFNVFGFDSGLRMLEYKIEFKYMTVLKPFFIYLKAIPNDKYVGIPMDSYAIEELRKL